MTQTNFASIVGILRKYVITAYARTQAALLEIIWSDYLQSSAGKDYVITQDAASRYLRGKDNPPDHIVAYYLRDGAVDAMATILEADLLPMLWDPYAVCETMCAYVQSDITLTQELREELTAGSPYTDRKDMACCIARMICFAQARK